MLKDYKFNFYSNYMNKTLTVFAKLDSVPFQGLKIDSLIVKTSSHSEPINSTEIKNEAINYFKNYLKEDLDNQS